MLCYFVDVVLIIDNFMNTRKFIQLDRFGFQFTVYWIY